MMIAMALACQPQILIADEPTTALDVTIQAQILDLIRDLNREMNTAVLFITHDLGVVSELCDTVIVMYTGHIVEQAPVRDLFRDPKHPYTVGLMSAIPAITKERKPLQTIEGMVPNPTEKIEGCSFWPQMSPCVGAVQEKGTSGGASGRRTSGQMLDVRGRQREDGRSGRWRKIKKRRFCRRIM